MFQMNFEINLFFFNSSSFNFQYWSLYLSISLSKISLSLINSSFSFLHDKGLPFIRQAFILICLHIPVFPETVIPAVPDYDMVLQRNTKDFPGIFQRSG